MSERYNGWANYPTWCVALWLDNEESSYRAWRDVAHDCWDETDADEPIPLRVSAAQQELVSRLKDHFEMGQDDLGLTGWWSDLMTYAINEVNWLEVALAILEGAEPWDD